MINQREENKIIKEKLSGMYVQKKQRENERESVLRRCETEQVRAE